MPRLLLIGLLALSGCALRHLNALMADDATARMLSNGGTSTPGAVIPIEPTTSGSLCASDDPDPQHTCPVVSGPDPR